MAFRFQRRVRIVPGLRMNISKSGIGFSVGPRGASLSIGKQGVHSHLGIPGTGLAYRQKHSARRGGSAGSAMINTGTEVTMRVKDDGKVEFELSDRSPAPASVIKRFRETHSRAIMETLENAVAEINASLDACLAIHMFTPAPHWRALPPPDTPPPEPKPSTPKQVGLLQRLMGRRASISAKNAAAAAAHADALSEWGDVVARFNKARDDIREINERAPQGDLSASQRMLDIRLAKIPWAKDTEVNYDLGDDVSTLAIDIDLPTLEELPSITAAMPSRGLNLKLSERSEIQRQKDLTHIAHASLFRVAGEAFAAVPMLRTIIISGYTQRPDPATGKDGDVYVISSRIDRNEWEIIDFDNLGVIDIVEAIGRFETVSNVKRGGYMGEIEPLAGG